MRRDCEDNLILRGMNREAQRLAFAWYLRRGRVPAKIKQILDATTSREAFGKYSADQPRVPAGNPGGGQWTDGGGGSGGDGNEIYDPPLRNVYPVEMLIGGITSLSLSGAASAIRVVIGMGRAIGAPENITHAADAIEGYFEGKPDVVKNRAGDLILMKDGKKIRFDINNTAPHDEPHFHVEKEVVSENGTNRWKPAGPNKLYSFRKD